jgi:predicted amidohydrolase
MPARPHQLIVGVWQGACDPDLNRNFDRAAEAVKRAALERCDFLCLPECFLTCYGRADVVQRNAITVEDSRLIELARLSAAANVTLLVGLAERRGDQLFNTHVVLDEGRIAGRYCKMMLTGPDREQVGFSAEYHLPVFEAKGVRFGIQICHDSGFPEIAAAFAAQGAKLLFSPHFNLVGPGRLDAHRLRARHTHSGLAALFGLVVARSNIVATEDGLGRLGYGDSSIFSPVGSALAEVGLFSEGLACVDIRSWLEGNWQERRREVSRGLLLAASRAVG